MRYMYSLFGEEGGMEDASPEDMKAELDRWEAFGLEAFQAGVLVAGDALQESSTATTFRIQEHGDPIVSDGPFVETKEQLGGYYVIEARDLNEAIHVASRIPGARIGCVEVRPIAEDQRTLDALGFVARTAQA